MPQEKSIWYKDVMSNISILSSAFELTAEERERLTTLCLSIAKQQYLMGNRAGISWARKQMRIEQTPTI